MLKTYMDLLLPFSVRAKGKEKEIGGNYRNTCI